MLEPSPSAAADDTSADTGINERIAQRVRELRAARALTLEALATRSGVSRSMISMIERGSASPTAVVLEKLAAGLGVSMASLFGGASESAPAEPLARRDAQVQWRDPQSGYTRRSLSPPNWPSPIQLVEVDFPPGARVAYEAGSREPFYHQQVWVIEGRLNVELGGQLHALETGDCLAMRRDQPLIFSNPASQPAHYIVAICDARSS
ncbi:XRE family transcriptional regulator [Paraburkholderia sp. J94]|uniref:helix-turn-helix domain-containing protein n=1 Tax=Paraburkholderia sp. J94 TaxID=2805441 RepID=UPI002AB1137B|nr:XRE family transcriptional regulator [Paraburkholderia sp. J94]